MWTFLDGCFYLAIFVSLIFYAPQTFHAIDDATNRANRCLERREIQTYHLCIFVSINRHVKDTEGEMPCRAGVAGQKTAGHLRGLDEHSKIKSPETLNIYSSVTKTTSPPHFVRPKQSLSHSRQTHSRRARIWRALQAGPPFANPVLNKSTYL